MSPARPKRPRTPFLFDMNGTDLTQCCAGCGAFNPHSVYCSDCSDERHCAHGVLVSHDCASCLRESDYAFDSWREDL